MKNNSCLAVAILVSMAFSAAHASLIITSLDLRSGGTGTFGATNIANTTSITINGTTPPAPITSANPIDVVLTMTNLDVEMDGTANDTINFTFRATPTAPATNARIFNQGFDTVFGTIDGIEFSVVNVSGATTDGGLTIVFDGFTEATAAAGQTGDIDSSVDVNGITTVLASPDTGAFQFLQSPVTLALAQTVTFDNSVNNEGGTVLARNFDLQFSAIPEPSVLGLLGFGFIWSLITFRQRRQLD